MACCIGLTRVSLAHPLYTQAACVGLAFASLARAGGVVVMGCAGLCCVGMFALPRSLPPYMCLCVYIYTYYWDTDPIYPGGNCSSFEWLSAVLALKASSFPYLAQLVEYKLCTTRVGFDRVGSDSSTIRPRFAESRKLIVALDFSPHE